MKKLIAAALITLSLVGCKSDPRLIDRDSEYRLYSVSYLDTRMENRYLLVDKTTGSKMVKYIPSRCKVKTGDAYLMTTWTKYDNGQSEKTVDIDPLCK